MAVVMWWKSITLLLILANNPVVSLARHKSSIVATPIESPDVSLNVPIDVFHLIDQSGSVEPEDYLNYLDFAQNLTSQMASEIGLDSDTSPGLRVSLFGFGCRLSTSRDQTNFFLLLESDVEVINKRFAEARHEEYYPDFSRTCLRYVMDHLEEGVKTSEDESAGTVRKTVVVLYTDGKSGDFDWPEVSKSPIFNSPDVVDVYAVGVAKNQKDKIVENIAHSEAHVFSDITDDSLNIISDRINSFMIDPYQLKYSMYAFDQEDINALGSVPSISTCVGRRLAIGFEKVTTDDAAQISEINVVPISTGRTGNELKDKKLQLLDTALHKPMPSRAREMISDVMSKNDIDVFNQAVGMLQKTVSISQAETASVLRGGVEEEYICVFNSASIDELVLSGYTIEVGSFENIVFCDIPTNMFAYKGVEDLSIDIYRVDSGSIENSTSIYDNLIGSIPITYQWNFCAETQILDDSEQGCSTGTTKVLFSGSSIASLLEYDNETTASCTVQGYESYSVKPTMMKDTIQCVFDDFQLVSQEESQSITFKLTAQNAEFGNSFQVTTSSLLSVSDLNIDGCSSISVDSVAVCRGDQVQVYVKSQSDLLPKLQQQGFPLFCILDQELVPVITSDNTHCNIPTGHVNEDSLVKIGYETNEGEIISITTGSIIDVNYQSDGCISASLLTFAADCSEDTTSEVSSVDFSGKGLTFFSDFTCVFEGSQPDEVFSVDAASKSSGGVYCAIERTMIFLPQRLSMLARSSQVVLYEANMTEIKSSCVDYSFSVGGFIQSSLPETLCFGDSIQIVLDEVFASIFTPQNIECLWIQAGDLVVTNSLEFSAPSHGYACDFPSVSLDPSLETILVLKQNGEELFPDAELSFPSQTKCVEANYANLEVFSQNPSLSAGMDSNWPGSCKRGNVDMVFSGDTILHLSNTSVFSCEFTLVGSQKLARTAQILNSSSVLCSAVAFDGDLFAEVTNVELLATLNNAEISLDEISLNVVDNKCVQVGTNGQCAESVEFPLTDVTLDSVVKSLLKNPDNLNVSCDLVILDEFSSDNETINLGFKTSSYEIDGLSVHEALCFVDSTTANPSTLNDFLFSHELENVSSALQFTIFSIDGDELFSFSQALDSSDMTTCFQEVKSRPITIVYEPVVAGLLSMGLASGLGCLFTYKRRRKYFLMYDKDGNLYKPMRRKSASSNESRNMSFDYSSEDLLDIIVEKENRLFESAKFEPNDLVVLDFNNGNMLSPTTEKVGIVVNKKVQAKMIKYEVKLLDEPSVIVTDLQDKDLERFTLKVGESVETMDELIDDKWNRSVVLKFDAEKHCCDVKQGSTRLNEVPLVCIRKCSVEAFDNDYSHIVVEVPNVRQQRATLPISVIEDEGKLRSAMKKMRTHASTQFISKHSSLESYSSLGSKSSGSKKVKFASDIPMTKWKAPARQRSSTQTEEMGLYKRRKPLSYREMDGTKYEIVVDVSKGLGVCWGFDPLNGSIIVGKFVDVNSGDWGSLESSGKVGLKDKLEMVDGQHVEKLRSLAKVREVIKHARKQKGIVSFVFSRGSGSSI